MQEVFRRIDQVRLAPLLLAPCCFSKAILNSTCSLQDHGGTISKDEIIAELHRMNIQVSNPHLSLIILTPNHPHLILT